MAETSVEGNGISTVDISNSSPAKRLRMETWVGAQTGCNILIQVLDRLRGGPMDLLYGHHFSFILFF